MLLVLTKTHVVETAEYGADYVQLTRVYMTVQNLRAALLNAAFLLFVSVVFSHR